MNKKYKSLAIVGNGFDLAHKYKTGFFNFTENTSNTVLDDFKQFCNANQIATWHNFEENINLLTMELWQNNFRDNCNYDEISNKIDLLNNIFINIQPLLIDYLNKETNSFKCEKKHNVEKHINAKTKVINFNYTNVAKLYTDDIFYIHGSLDEKDIVLGYDFRLEPCLISMEYMYWCKNFRRESLAFKRYLANNNFSRDDEPNYETIMEEFDKYQMYANSGRGIDEELKDEIKYFEIINDFICNLSEKMIWPNINYKQIKTIVVLGHSLESDQEFLKILMQKLTKLKKVIIFRYNHEPESSINKKRAFFKQYHKKIVIKNYD